MDVRATVRCPTCFHVNADQAPRCSGCGGELGLEPIGEPSPFVCPGCEHALEAFRGEWGALHDCGRCGGQFVEHLVLIDLLGPREGQSSVAPIIPPRPLPGPGAVRYLPCPACHALMNRKNFGRTSGVVVDICRQHGTWFDAGELPRVLAFARAAASARPPDRDDEEARRQRRAAAAAIGAALPRYYREGPALCDGSAPGDRVVKLLLGAIADVAG